MEGGASSLARTCSSAILAARPCPSLFLLLLHPSVLFTSSCHTRRLTLSASPSPSPLSRTRKIFPILDCLSSDCFFAPPLKEAFSRQPDLATATRRESRLLAKSAREVSAKKISAAENVSAQENLVASQQDKVPLRSQKVSGKRKKMDAELKDDVASVAETVLSRKNIHEELQETVTDDAETTERVSLRSQKVSRRKKKDAELNEIATTNAHTGFLGLQKVSRRNEVPVDREESATVSVETGLSSLEKSHVRSENASLKKKRSVQSKNKPDASLEPGLSVADHAALSVKGSPKMSRRKKILPERKENASASAGTDISPVFKPLLISEKVSRTEMPFGEANNKQAAGLETDLQPVENFKVLGPQKVSGRKKIHEQLKERASASPEIDILSGDETLQRSVNNTALRSGKALGLPKVSKGKKRHAEELKTNRETDFLLEDKTLLISENVSGKKMQGTDATYAKKKFTKLNATSVENTALRLEDMSAKGEVFRERDEKLIASSNSSAASNLRSSDETESLIVLSSELSDFSAFQKKAKSLRTKKVALPSSQPENQTTLSEASVTKRSSSSTKIERQLPEKQAFANLPEHVLGRVSESQLPTLERTTDSDLVQSSVEELRAVENSVERASLIEGIPISSDYERHSLGERSFSRVKEKKRSFPLVDSSTSMDTKASISSTSSIVGEEGIFRKPSERENTSKADSKSNRNHVWKEAYRAKTANTGRTEPVSSLDDFDSNASQVMKKNNGSSGESCVEEDISVTAEGMPSSETILIPSSQEWAVLKNKAISLQEMGLRKETYVNSAEKKASLSFAKASSSMSTPSTHSKNTQSQHAAVTEVKFLANNERAGGKIKTAPKQLSIRNVKANQASTISYMQILGTGFDTGDTVPTVLLFFDRRRFIFNAGEGLHRFCIEHKIKLSKIDHIFLTRVCSKTTGGLPGLFLTLAGMGDNGMTAQVWGPSTLQDLVNAMRTFVPSASMVHTHCFGSKEDHGSAALLGLSPPILLVEDELVKISAVLLRPSSCSRGRVENKKNVGSDSQVSQVWAYTESDTNEFIPREEKTCNDVSVAYICELPKVAGKFDSIKALAKGLKPGFKYGKLQRGESVLSDDGLNMVHPEDVLGPSSRGPIMILVDCPSASHIPALISASSLLSFFSEAGKVVDCMVHISPVSVTKHKEYQDWARNFSEAHHIIAGQQVEGLGMPVLRSSAKILSKLNLVCPQVFPVVEPYGQSHEQITDPKKEQIGHTLVAENLLKFRFRPLSAIGPDRSDVPEPFDFIATQKDMMREYSEISEARDYVAQVWKEQDVGNATSNLVNGGLADGNDVHDLPECLQYVTRKEMEVVFLGTGSSQPSTYRNVSAIYIHLFEHGGVLLDCGEGTYAQLKRRYGAKGADDVLMGLKLIWISHMHADHHTGLPRILSVRRQLMEEKSSRKHILVVGPGQLKRFLQAYEKVEDLDMEFLDCNQTTSEAKDFSAKVIPVSEQTDELKYGERASCNLDSRKRGLIRLPQEAGSDGSRKGQMQNLWKQPGLYFQQGIDVAGREKLQSLLHSLGLKDLVSVPVVHCLNAFGVVLEAEGKQLQGGKIQSGWKLVYSGM